MRTVLRQQVGDEGVVLTSTPDSPTAYATHIFDPTTGARFWGSYWVNYEDAIGDYLTRLRQLQARHPEVK